MVTWVYVVTQRFNTTEIFNSASTSWKGTYWTGPCNRSINTIWWDWSGYHARAWQHGHLQL